LDNEKLIKSAAKIRKALNNQITSENLIKYIQSLDFSVVFYDKDGTVLKRYGLEEHIEYSKTVKAFTYTYLPYKYVFVSEDLSEETILIYLLHELSHIELGHMNKIKNLRNLQKEEMEAHTLTYSVLNPPKQNFKTLCLLVAMVLSVGAIAGSKYVKLRN